MINWIVGVPEDGIWDVALRRRKELHFEVLEYREGSWRDVFGNSIHVEVESYKKHGCGDNCICELITKKKENE
jgi:hypothetical protein